MSKITTALWADPVYRDKQAGRSAWNKLDESKLLTKVCPECNNTFVVVPSHSSRKCRSRPCANKHRAGKPHVNWNPASLASSGYKTCKRGWFMRESLTFRSSYELAALIHWINQNNLVEAEPFYVWYEYNGKRHRYFPDYLINGTEVVEIKPTSKLNDPRNQAKFAAITEYCTTHNLTFTVLTEIELQFPSPEAIQELVNSGKLFFTKGVTPCTQK